MTRFGWMGVVVLSAAMVGCGSDGTGPSEIENEPTGLIAFRGAGDLWTVSPADGSITQVTTTPTPFERFSWRTSPWSPDGARLTYMASAEPGTIPEQIWVVGVDGSNPVQLTSGPSAGILPDWSPDGRSLVFSRWTDDVNKIDLFVVDVLTGAERTLVSEVGYDQEPEWSPVSDRIAYLRTEPGCCGAYHVFSVASDGSDNGRVLEGHVQRFGWSSDGARLAAHRRAIGEPGGYRVVVADADGSGIVHLTPEVPDEDGRYFHSWSPDGSWVALGAAGQLIVSRRDGSETREIVNLPDDVDGASWSPDGEWLAFRRSPESGGGELWIVRADGSELRQVETNGISVASAYWSPR